MKAKRRFLIIILLFVSNIATFFISRSLYKNKKPEIVIAKQEIIPYVLDSTRYIGPVDATVSVLEFSDFDCPYSQKTHSEIQQLLQTYSNKVKYAFINLPLSLEPYKVNRAKAVIAASKQGKALEMKNILFKNPYEPDFECSDEFMIEEMCLLAQKLDLDSDVFKKDLQSSEIESILKEDLEQMTVFDIKSSPSVLINGYRIRGTKPASVYRSIINYLLKRS